MTVSLIHPVWEKQSTAQVVEGPLQTTWPTSPLPTWQVLPFPQYVHSYGSIHSLHEQWGIVYWEQYYERAHNLEFGYLSSSSDFNNVVGCF